MSKFRKWINRDDGKLFQVRNESLNGLEIVGYGLLICSFLLNAVKNLELISLPKWSTMAVAAAALVLAFIGNYRKHRTKPDAADSGGDLHDR